MADKEKQTSFNLIPKQGKRLSSIIEFLINQGLKAKDMARILNVTYQAFRRNVVACDDLDIDEIILLIEACEARAKIYLYDTPKELEYYKRYYPNDGAPVTNDAGGEKETSARGVAAKRYVTKRLDTLAAYMKSHSISETALAEKTGLNRYQIVHMMRVDNTSLSKLITIAQALKCHLLLDIRVEQEENLFPEEPSFICDVTMHKSRKATFTQFEGEPVSDDDCPCDKD